MADDTTKPDASLGPEDFASGCIRQAVQDMVAFTQQLIETDVPIERVWFRNMLVGILNSTRENYRSVEIGIVKMPTLASWGARNLLELRMITTYVLRSADDALAFKDDFAADLKEFWEAMKQSGEYVHKTLVAQMRDFANAQPEPIRSAFLDKAAEMERTGPDLSGPLEEMETYRKLMEDFGIDSKRRPNQGSKIAEMVKESEMYKPRFKIHSKLVHPTALYIAAMTTPNSLHALMPLISSEASSDVMAIFFTIKDHVVVNGIAPKH